MKKVAQFLAVILLYALGLALVEHLRSTDGFWIDGITDVLGAVAIIAAYTLTP